LDSCLIPFSLSLLIDGPPQRPSPSSCSFGKSILFCSFLCSFLPISFSVACTSNYLIAYLFI
jgi:hypothetical protein